MSIGATLLPLSSASGFKPSDKPLVEIVSFNYGNGSDGVFSRMNLFTIPVIKGLPVYITIIHASILPIETSNKEDKNVTTLAFKGGYITPLTRRGSLRLGGGLGYSISKDESESDVTVVTCTGNNCSSSSDTKIKSMNVVGEVYHVWTISRWFATHAGVEINLFLSEEDMTVSWFLGFAL